MHSRPRTSKSIPTRMACPTPGKKSNELDPASASDNQLDSDGDGYTNIEEFLNGTDPREKVDYTNLGNNVDTIS